MSNKKKRYSYAERKAYHMGVGAYMGFGKVRTIKAMTKGMTAEERKSFNNGFDSMTIQKK